MSLSWPRSASDTRQAQCQYHLKEYYGAISDTGSLLKSYPRHIQAYQLRGEAYFRLNDMEMAVKHFREALKLDPEHKGALRGKLWRWLARERLGARDRVALSEFDC